MAAPIEDNSGPPHLHRDPGRQGIAPWPDAPTASLAHGGLYRICFPHEWNGDLVLFAHGYVAPQNDLAMPEESVGGQPLRRW